MGLSWGSGGRGDREKGKERKEKREGKKSRPERGNPAWFLEDKGINNKIGLIGEEKNSWVVNSWYGELVGMKN